MKKITVKLLLIIMRKKCMDCSITTHEVEFCPQKECPLWLFRFGEMPSEPAKKPGKRKRS